jgi:hypothetical protein
VCWVKSPLLYQWRLATVTSICVNGGERGLEAVGDNEDARKDASLDEENDELDSDGQVLSRFKLAQKSTALQLTRHCT